MSDPRVAELMRRTLSGDLNAFGEVVDRFRGAVLGLCYHRCGDFETARDLAQEAFIRAYQHLGQLDDPARFSSWLRRIAEHVCIDWRRRQHDVQPLTEAADPATSSMDDVVALRVTVERALAALPEAQRLAVTLFHIDGYSYGEIAEFLSTSETTVRGRLDAARAALRGALADTVRGALQAQSAPEGFLEEVMMRVTQVQMKRGIDRQRGGPAAYLVLGGEERAVGMQIGFGEATAIRVALDRAETPRPMTYELMLSTWAAFGIRLTSVRVTGMQDTTILAELELTRDRSVKRVDCRPSDAINLALRADTPVEVDESVLSKIGMSAEEAERDYGNLPDYSTEDPDLPTLY